MKNAKGIQNGDASTVAKINIGITPFNPAVIMVSVGNRLPIEVKMQAINKADRLKIAEIPANFHRSYFLEVRSSL